MKILVTGGAGFIGSAVCRLFVGEFGATVLNVDKLTYAANPESLKPIADNPRYRFCRADILDRKLIAELLRELRARRDPASRRGIACRSLDRRPRRVHQDQYRGHLRAAGGGARILARLAAGAGGAVPLSPRLDRRGVRLARSRRAGSAKTAATSRILPMPPRKPPRTIWCAPGTRPSACRPS